MKCALAVVAVASLAACGGGKTSGSGGAQSYAATLSSLESRFGQNPELTREGRLPTGSARYDGVASFNLTNAGNIDPDNFGPGYIRGYTGQLRLNVDFRSDRLTGNIGSFQNLNQRGVPGQVSISGGRLTGNNRDGLGDGLRADATGSIDGRTINMDVEGSFYGRNGDGVALWFDDPNRLWGGVGLAGR